VEVRGIYHMKKTVNLDKCPACGGVIVTDQNSITSACPYCGNTAFMRDRVTGSYQPDYIA
jgi:predicted RNA-binding Zn-ribbon protein involved in translation (DUF1610 family)